MATDLPSILKSVTPRQKVALEQAIEAAIDGAVTAGAAAGKASAKSELKAIVAASADFPAFKTAMGTW